LNEFGGIESRPKGGLDEGRFPNASRRAGAGSCGGWNPAGRTSRRSKSSRSWTSGPTCATPGRPTTTPTSRRCAGRGSRSPGWECTADQAIAALAFYLESSLSHFLLRTTERALALSLVRLTAAIQRFLIAGYTQGRAAGWQRTDEKDRLKLSRDLHDEIGADLVVLKLYIEMIANELRKGQVEGARSKLEEALALVAHAVDSVRRLTLDLGPAILDQIGFGPALKLYCRQFAARTGLAVKVQEASPLTSFDAARQPPAGAFGLAAMRGRIEGLGGRLHVESRPARPSGTRIEIDLPLKELAAP